MRRDRFRFRLTLQVVCSSLLLSSCALLRGGGEIERPPAMPVFIGARNLVSGKPGSSRLDVDVRVPLSFFVFVRAAPESASHPFLARSDIAVEVFDRARASVARTILRRELPSPVQSPHMNQFLEKLFSFDLPPGTYNVSTEVNDLESSRKFIDRNREIVLKDFSRDSLQISDVLFLTAPVPPDSGTVSAAAFGENLPFGRSAYGYLEFISSAPPESIRASYAIRSTEPESGERASSNPGALKHVEISRSRFLECVPVGDEFSYRVGPSARNRIYSVWIPEEGDTLTVGSYELETRVSDGVKSAGTTQQFRIRWIDRPRSLGNTSQALEALRYIASDSEVNEMRSASPERQKSLFTSFWKKRDPTPATAFNEQMAEFYRRVDYATENFGTLREPNGMRSDRGRAYILYGPPGSIDRNLLPGSAPEETWSYPNLHKRLLFIDKDRHGDYKLSATGDI